MDSLVFCLHFPGYNANLNVFVVHFYGPSGHFVPLKMKTYNNKLNFIKGKKTRTAVFFKENLVHSNLQITCIIL